jgi:TrmH family RNA methyltransferase
LKPRAHYDLQKGTGLTSSSQIAATRLRRIEGKHNALVKELRQAFARGELTATGECPVEGARVVEEAIRSGLKFRAIFFSESAQGRAAKLLPQIHSHVETLLLPDRLFANSVPSEMPQGVAALVHVKKFALKEIIAAENAGPLLVIAGVQDPGNLGTILRSAEAFGARGVLLGEGTVSAYNSKTVRASAGSIFRVMTTKVQMAEAITATRSQGFRLLATSSHKGETLPGTDLSGKVAIFIGNEGSGLDKKLLAQMDTLIMVPHSPRVESLNAGVAASIVLYEAARGRTD